MATESRMSGPAERQETSESFFELARSRRSTRAFLRKPVSDAVVRRVLTIAQTAPSGSNTQPWRAYVLRGEALEALCAELQAAYMAGEPRRPEYQYYASPLPEPHLQRRRACGWGLYTTLGIARGDVEKSRDYRVRNYRFFGAPVGIVFTMNRHLSHGSWVDYGMFLQTAMLAARSFGLDTCAQAAIAEYPDIIRRRLNVPEQDLILCGLAIGYADASASVNAYQPVRGNLSEFVTFVGDETQADTTQSPTASREQP